MTKQKNMKLKEITPAKFMCAGTACPAVYAIEQGDKLVIVGQKVDNIEELGIGKKVGKHEQVVIVDKNMLKKLFEK